MSDDAPARRGLRLALWLHALVWVVFAGGMIALALASRESRENPIFVQVLAGASVAAVGSLGAARFRIWGVALALIGGGGVLLAWIAGGSGRELRLPVAIILGLFALAVAAERRAFVSSDAR
ncbi:hypothetical protein [Erythrobacter sp. HL-111]|uniref:hypothetical protein n=1 Tax=Erythrobacter sp. HL-111 TaxID=1798193 RepID=UPI0006DA4519|nr:hypothetical protein [Erythrobacter sp. HL-111]KPP94448.1 MAG: Fatty acid desaturase [Erythrobacteraceae bacterium HL-111]SDS57572.1 hypothetical protein SAMN04515621_1817 [Erythrobacter sp. HL-111]